MNCLKTLLAFSTLLCAVGEGSAQTIASSQPEEQQTSAAAVVRPSEGHPIGAVTVGYIYLDSQTSPGGSWDSHLHGFYAIPQIAIKPWLSVFGDFTQSYNTGYQAHESVQARLGGFLFSAPNKTRFTPVAFTNGGVIRDSNKGTVVISPAFAVGGGWSTKLNSRVSLLVVPAEYVRVFAPAGDLNNFTARMGFSFPIYWRKSR